MMKHFSSIQTVARVMNVTVQTVKRWIKDEKLKSLKCKNGETLILIADLYNFVCKSKRYNNLLHRYRSEYRGRSKLLNVLMNNTYMWYTFSINEVATVMNVTKRTVNRWIEEGKMKRLKDSRNKSVISTQSIIEFLDCNIKYHNLIERYIDEIESISDTLNELFHVEDEVIDKMIKLKGNECLSSNMADKIYKTLSKYEI